jgi:hypothetical protein
MPAYIINNLKSCLKIIIQCSIIEVTNTTAKLLLVAILPSKKTNNLLGLLNKKILFLAGSTKYVIKRIMIQILTKLKHRFKK